MQQAPANVPVKTFRVVTTASAGAVYALLAWRTHTSFGQNPVTNSIVGANLVACCIAFSRVRGHKRLLKSVLITDIGLEAILFLSSAWNLFFPSKNLTNKDFEFASLISSIWFVLIALTCLRSNWIVAPPASSSTDSQSSSYRPHHHSMPPTRTPPY